MNLFTKQKQSHRKQISGADPPRLGDGITVACFSVIFAALFLSEKVDLWVKITFSCSSFSFSSFIEEVSPIHHTTHPFKLYDSITLSIFRVVHLSPYSICDCFHQPEKITHILICQSVHFQKEKKELIQKPYSRSTVS